MGRDGLERPYAIVTDPKLAALFKMAGTIIGLGRLEPQRSSSGDHIDKGSDRRPMSRSDCKGLLAELHVLLDMALRLAAPHQIAWSVRWWLPCQLPHKVHGHNCTIKKAGPQQQFEVDLMVITRADDVQNGSVPVFNVHRIIEVKSTLHDDNKNKAVQQVSNAAKNVKEGRRFVFNGKPVYLNPAERMELTLAEYDDEKQVREHDLEDVIRNGLPSSSRRNAPRNANAPTSSSGADSLDWRKNLPAISTSNSHVTPTPSSDDNDGFTTVSRSSRRNDGNRGGGRGGNRGGGRGGNRGGGRGGNRGGGRGGNRGRW